MSHVTIYQAEKLRELGFPQKEPHQRTLYGRCKSVYTPSAEELMEWLATQIGEYSVWHRVTCWRVDGFEAPTLIDALFQAACWVLEGKK